MADQIANPATLAEVELLDLLLKALAALGEVGEADRANRLAGAAYSSLRRRDPKQAQRINVLMHRLVACG